MELYEGMANRRERVVASLVLPGGQLPRLLDDEVVIVDESTGRLMDGRKWQDGLHQAVEAKELVPITAATGQAARVTVQDFFRQYTHLAGMTGTAVLARRELKKIYQLKVIFD